MGQDQEGRAFVMKETLIVLAGEIICSGLVLAVSALLGRLDRPVLLGALVGVLLAVGNFFMMAVSAGNAADKAVQQDVKGGRALMRSSYMIRMAVIAVILFVLARAGVVNAIPAILPLIFVRWILTVAEFFRKKGNS